MVRLTVTSGHSNKSKRLLDLATLGVVALPAGVVGLAASAWIRLTSPGPVLFRQQRVGLDQREFECLKFRTMVHGDNPLIPDTSRITTAGRWLRRFSLDELPQLINVAKGEMSVVGPRPMLPFQAERCSPDQARRFDVRPGLTGLAQVSGRNALSWTERIELDVAYVESASLWSDIRIMLATFGALVGGAGVEGHDANDPFVQPPESTDA